MTTTLPAALHGHPVVVVDVEGNGQQPPDIIELAALPVTDTTTQADLHVWLIRPPRPISALVTRKVHGISNADVAACPAWSDVADDIGALLTDRVLVAHNASVEHRVLRSHLPTWQPPLVLDTLRLAKHRWPGLDAYALDKLTAHAHLDTSGLPGQRAHRAGHDTWCTFQLLCRLLQDSELDWATLVTIAALPVSARTAEPEGLW